jgi:hypothetical protein
VSERPELRIVRGTPTPEELAAITVLVTAAASAGGRPASEPTRRGHWNDRAAAYRRPWRYGPGAWHAALR